nr:MAG TPA: hypothetical protein [Caudoviricetes sp.]
MRDITVSGQLPYGHKDEQGAIHRDFVMRPVTLADLEAMEDAYPDLLARDNWLTRRRLTWAFALEKLGDLPKGAITPELLAGLPLQDFNVLAAAEDDLAKKLRAAYGREEDGV